MTHRRSRTVAGLLTVALLCPIITQTASVDGAPSPYVQRNDDLATLRDYLSGNGLLNRGLYELAAEEYQTFLREHPKHQKAAHARYGLGVALFRQKKYEDAARELTQIAEMDSFEFAAETNLLLGQSHLQLGAFAEAESAFARLVREHPEHDAADDAAALRIETLYRLNRHDEVAPAVESFITTWPNNVLRERVELFDGLSRIARSDTTAAIRRFEGMLKRFPKGKFAKRATLLLARSFQRANRPKDATAQYEHVLEQGNPAFVPDALYALGAILRRQGDLEQAAIYLDLLIADHADSALVPAARFERGRVLLDQDQFETALREFAAVEEAATDLSDDAAYWSAKADMRLEKYDHAALRLGEALATYPQSSLNAEMQYDRGIAQLRANVGDDAIKTFSAFRRDHPDHAMAAESLRLMATTAHQFAEYEASRRYADQYLESYPDNEHTAELAFLGAENAFLAGDFSDASHRFEAFLEAHADDAQAKNATFRLGLARDRIGDSDGAIKALSAIVNAKKTDPAFASALFALGNIAFDRGEWLSAEEHFFNYLALEKSDNIDDALIRLGLAQQRQRKYDSSLVSYARLLENHSDSPHVPQALFEKGQALVSLGRPDEAITSFKTLLKLEDIDRFAPHALNHLGAIAMARGDYTDAYAWYGGIESYDVDDQLAGEALFQKAQALMALDRFADAEKAFAAVTAKYPQHDRANLARVNTALATARQSDYARTLDAIAGIGAKAISSISPELRTTILYEKAWAHRSLDQADEAHDAYQEILSIVSASTLRDFAAIELGELLSQGRQFEEAAKLFRAFDFDNDALPADLHERGLYRLGVCEYELQRFQEAANAFDVFITNHGESEMIASAELLCGEALFKLGKYSEARPYLTRVVQDHPQTDMNAPALLRLGECEAHEQDWDASGKSFMAFLSQYPESEVWFQAQFGIGWARENAAKFDDAIEAYMMVVDRHRGETAARAQFQIGECLFAQKKYDEAVRELLKVDILYAYPQWSSAAIFEAGKCLEALNQLGQAKKQYRHVAEHYADTKWAEMAERRLTALARSDLPGRGGG